MELKKICELFRGVNIKKVRPHKFRRTRANNALINANRTGSKVLCYVQIDMTMQW